jgi:hypothetical protein
MPQLSPLSLTLSLWTVCTSPPLILPCLVLRLFSNAAFPRPRDGAAASLCAAANYNPTRKHEDYNDDGNDYDWGGEGHHRDHPGLDHRGDSSECWRNRLRTLPSMGDPLVADDRQPPPPPVDCPPGGHNRDAGVAVDDKLACFAQLLRSKHDPPLDVAAVDENGD